MGEYECAKCDETMISKNPAIRGIFPSDGIASAMTNITNVVTKRGEDGKRVVTFEFPYSDTGSAKDEADDYLEMSCARIIKNLTEEQLMHWLCNHKWKLVGGEEMPM